MNRKQARENAFILIFEAISKGDETAIEIYEKAIERELLVDDFVKQVFFGSMENYKLISEYVEKSLIGWKKERISTVSKAILTLASYEMIFMDDIPTKVSINEGIELSKKYDDEKAYALVNGSLNAIAELAGKK
jgi:N utilization substance protein B